jgi:hypothetical protein
LHFHQEHPTFQYLFKMVSFRSLCLHLVTYASFGAAHPHAHAPRAQPHSLPPSLQIRDPASKLDARQAAHDAIRGGGWLLNYQAGGTTYDGTLRVENNQTHLIVSGDLYTRTTAPSPSAGIPIFPAESHNSYIRVTGYAQRTGGFDLTLELWRSNGKDAQSMLLWSGPGSTSFVASISRKTAPSGYPSANDYFEGDVKSKADGSTAGRLTMGWISTFFRKMTVEIDTVADVEVPESDGGSHTWKSVFADVGFDVTLDVSDRNLPDPLYSQPYTNKEAHAAMLKYRKPVDFSKEWRIHLLVAKRVGGTARGTMYDSGAADENKLPREGAIVAANWKFGNNANNVPDGTKWGDAIQSKRFGEVKPAFFRAAVHEIGHALSLYHPIDQPELAEDFKTAPFDLGFMTPTEEYLRYQNELNLGFAFPGNIQWSFHPMHQLWLKHISDQHIRPAYSEWPGRDFYTPANPGNLVGRDEETVLLGSQAC